MRDNCKCHQLIYYNQNNKIKEKIKKKNLDILACICFLVYIVNIYKIIRQIAFISS